MNQRTFRRATERIQREVEDAVPAAKEVSIVSMNVGTDTNETDARFSVSIEVMPHDQEHSAGVYAVFAQLNEAYPDRHFYASLKTSLVSGKKTVTGTIKMPISEVAKYGSTET